MSKLFVYWSGTGNTESIANQISGDVNADCRRVGEVSVNEVLGCDTIILGCPAMGSEELEDMEFKPFYDELIKKVDRQRIFLFGSYDWGDGEWMKLWQDDVFENGKTLGGPGLIVNGDISMVDEKEYEEFISNIMS